MIFRNSKKNRICHSCSAIVLAVILTVLLCGCGKEVEIKVETTSSEVRSNESVVLVPEAGKQILYGTDDFIVDATNAGEGYIVVDYEGDNDEVRLQVSGNGSVTYTFLIPKGETVLPITAGSGNYTLVGYEAIMPGEYATSFSEDVSITITNELGPYLYPNQYVNFDKDSKAVSLAKTLAADCTCDLEVIGTVYKYMTDNIVYDHEKAENVANNYLPDIDEILDSGKGICFDYAAVMAAMLRSQRIPTRLEIGYAGEAYHAWVSTYVSDIGWISGVIRFDGTDWTLMDPTFAANASAGQLKDFIGNGDNYVTKYVY